MVIVDFKIMADICDTLWFLQAENSLTQNENYNNNIPVAEVNLFKISARDMTLIDTH